LSLAPLRVALSSVLHARLSPLIGGDATFALVLAAADAADVDLRIVTGDEWLAELARGLSPAAARVVVAEAPPDLESLLAWLRNGAADVLTLEDAVAPGLARRLHVAVERHRLDRDARHAYSTDLATGLPHRQQLVEHMSHLIALRERQPAPMAVLVLRVEGIASASARLGREAADVLRRKLAVRLRAGVRASDVVAALGDDSYAVLLAALLAPGDAAHVGAKLLTALRAPFQLAGQEVAIAAALGIALHLQDGAQPEALLARASALAAAAPAEGRHSGVAANDG
jgi:diguanylate cyclase (GGDEF)-like protein